MSIIKIAGHDVPIKTIMRYINHLHKANTPDKIGDVQAYEYFRATYHNNIFLMAGFENVRGRARVEYQDTEFATELTHLITDLMACQKEGHGTTDRNGFCFECGRVITARDSRRTLQRIIDDKKRHGGR